MKSEIMLSIPMGSNTPHMPSRPAFNWNPDGQFLLIAGPCVIESLDLCLSIAVAVRDTCRKLGIPFVFKASFDKANRSSAKSYRGFGLEEGLSILAAVRDQAG